MEEVLFEDTRYSWQVWETGDLSLRCHDRPDAFGERAFEVARMAIEQQRQLFNVDLEQPIRIYIYNTDEEFAAWNDNINVEFISGQAFPALGITTQIVPDEHWQDAWLNEVLPHEISHLYFYQAAGLPGSNPPSWLDEGVAQYNEFNGHAYELRAAREAVLAGEYISLRGLTGSFGYAEDKFGLAYHESISAVTYLVDAYGEEGLMRLVAAYREGQPTTRAFPTALDVPFEQFEFEWLASLGVPDGLYSYADNGITLQVDVELIPTQAPLRAPDAPARSVATLLRAFLTATMLATCCGGLILAGIILVIVLASRKQQGPNG